MVEKTGRSHCMNGRGAARKAPRPSRQMNGASSTSAAMLRNSNNWPTE